MASTKASLGHATHIPPPPTAISSGAVRLTQLDVQWRLGGVISLLRGCVIPFNSIRSKPNLPPPSPYSHLHYKMLRHNDSSLFRAVKWIIVCTSHRSQCLSAGWRQLLSRGPSINCLERTCIVLGIAIYIFKHNNRMRPKTMLSFVFCLRLSRNGNQVH